MCTTYGVLGGPMDGWCGLTDYKMTSCFDHMDLIYNIIIIGIGTYYITY